MSTEAGPKGKGGRAPTNANDADSIMPLLLATIGNPAISFKKMAAMDELGRTESSLEHKFRKWRQKGREIAAENPEHAGNLGAASAGAAITNKPRTPSKKGASGTVKGPAKQPYVRDEDEENEIEETGTVKQEPDEMGGIAGGLVPASTKGKVSAASGIKKRAASEKVAAAEHEGGEAPVKKAKVVKKGTAKVVKKSKYKVDSGSEDEDTASEDEEKVPSKTGIGNVVGASGKGKTAAKSALPAKARKEKAKMAAVAGQIPIHEDADADVDMNSGYGHYNGMIDMQFDEAA